MVRSFNFSRLPLIHFGAGKIAILPGLIRKYGDSVLIISGKSSFLRTERAEKLFGELKKSGIRSQITSVKGEPSPDIVDSVVRRFSTGRIDLVVSIGGGSAIDAGKAVSAMMYKNESVLDYLEGVGTKDHPGTKIPFIAVPTTSGTGSEATKNAVISRVGNDGFKKSLRHDNLVPDIALVDPETTFNCPADITAASGMDCFTQLTEAYLSEKSCEYTDAFALEGLRAISESLLRAVKDGQDREARTGMSFAALTSGICLANAGLGVVHGFASSIGGLYEIPHGVVCGTLMAATNRLMVRRLNTVRDSEVPLKKYAQLGRIFTGGGDRKDDYFIDAFLDHLDRLTDELNLPGLRKAGIPEDDIERIASLTECKNNPVKLSNDDLITILKTRYV